LRSAQGDFAREKLHIARKQRHRDEGDPPMEPYDPYGPDNGIDAV
jgi:hypothetical protein